MKSAYERFLETQRERDVIERLKLTCASCGTGFQKYACQIKSTQQATYCSKACVGKAKRHGSELFCALCDSPFYRRFGEQDLGIRVRQFCSRPCYMEWRAINRSPETYLKTGTVHSHRVVAETHLGRKLKPEEVVHHGDDDKQNNAPSNLYVLPSQALHARVHFGHVSAKELRKYSLVRLAAR